MPIDYTKYPPNWSSEIRPRIMKRANNKCEFCGLEHGQTVYSVRFKISENGKYTHRCIWFRSREDAEREANYQNVREVKVVLTIAHLDHDEMNHKITDDRLKALCQCCHLRYDAKEKYRRINSKSF